MKKIWSSRKDRDKRRSFRGSSVYVGAEQSEQDQHNGRTYSSERLDDQSTLANSTIGSIPESSETDYTATTKNSIRTVATLAKNDYDHQQVKNSWLNVTVNPNSVHEINEYTMKVLRAELKGSHLYLYKPTILNAKSFRITKDEEPDAKMDMYKHSNDSNVSTVPIQDADGDDSNLTYFQADEPHPDLKYDFKNHRFSENTSVEPLLHFMLFETDPQETNSITQLITVLPMFPNFGKVLRILLSFLTNLYNSKFEGEFNLLIVIERVLDILANVKQNLGGFLLKSDTALCIRKILDLLSENLSDPNLLHRVENFKNDVLSKQEFLVDLISSDLPMENPLHDLDSYAFMNNVNLMEFTKTINFIDLSYFRNWNSNIDKSLLLYSSINDNNPHDFFYRKNPLFFDNDYHIHYLSRLLVNHLFIESTNNSTPALEKKARLVEKWIDLGCLLEKSGNMSSWIGISSIILSQPVLRLTKVWSLVSPDYIKLLKNDWSPVLFELDRRYLVNGSIPNDQILKVSDSSNPKFDDFITSRDSYHIMAPRGLGKIYRKENVIPFFGDLVINNNSTDIKELDSIWRKINYSFNRWNEYLSNLTNYEEIINYNDDVLRRYDNMGFIFSNESLHQVLYLGVNSDDTKSLPTKMSSTPPVPVNNDLQRKLLKLIEINCDSINLERIMKLSLILEPELPESYLKASDGQSKLGNIQNHASNISIHSNDSMTSLPSLTDNISTSAPLSTSDTASSKIPTFNNNYFKISFSKYDDISPPSNGETLKNMQNLDSSVIKHNFMVDNYLSFRIDDFVTDLEPSLINSSTLQGLDEIDNIDEDDVPGLGIDVEDILNSDKFNNLDINDDKNSRPTTSDETSQKQNQNRRQTEHSIISIDSMNYGHSLHYNFIPKIASIDKLIDLLLIDAKYFNENISINLSEYRFVFLLNYNSFITTKDLLDKLSHRFINSSNAIVSIMKKLYLLKNGDIDIQQENDFPNWEFDTSVNLNELGDVDYELLLKVQVNILKVLIVLINSFYSNFVNDLVNKKILIKLLKLFSNEILQWYNSNKIDSRLEESFESLVNYYKKLKKLFVKKTYRPIEIPEFDAYLIREFRFSNSLHEVPINRNLPGHKNVNKIEKFLHKFNSLLAIFYKGIKSEDWIRVYKVMENQFENNSLFEFNLQRYSVNDENLIVSNIFHYFESLTDPQEKQLILKRFPLVFRKLFKLYFKFRSYLLLQLSDLNITADERLDRMKTLLLMLKISKIKMSEHQFVFEGERDNIPSCIESAITNVIYLPESRSFTNLWIKASNSFNENGSISSIDDLDRLLPTNISEGDFIIQDPLLPCFGWVIENLIEANKCPSFHMHAVNFNKRYLIYKIVKELCIEDIEDGGNTGLNYRESKEFEFLLKLDESLVNSQSVREFTHLDKDKGKLFRAVLRDQHKLLLNENKKKQSKQGTDSTSNPSNSSSNSQNTSQYLTKKSSNSSLRRQSLSYKSNSSSRFKISGLFGKSRPFSLSGSNTSERILNSNELPDPESHTDPKQKPYFIIPLKNKKIFPVYSMPFAFKIDSDSSNDDAFFQAPSETDLNDWLIKLNFANRHWFYSKTLNLKANHTFNTFGIPIEVVCNRDQSPVPLFLQVIFEEIENEGLNDVGIYRISSSLSELNLIKSNIDKTGTINFSERSYDTHALASCVKSFFRELPDALILDEVIESFFTLRKSEDPDGVMAIDNYKQLLSLLPPVNYQTLKLLLKHLKIVSSFSEFNKMTASNLATVIGPALTEASNLDCLINNFGFMNSILEKLITNYDNVFQDDH